MATATSSPRAKAPRSRPRIAGYVALGLLAIAVLWLAFNFSSIKGKAELGAAYGAHVACSCRYIEGRDLKSCQSDMEPGTEMIGFTDDPVHKRITASVPLLASATAERRGKFGCLQMTDEELKAAN